MPGVDEGRVGALRVVGRDLEICDFAKSALDGSAIPMHCDVAAFGDDELAVVGGQMGLRVTARRSPPGARSNG